MRLSGQRSSRTKRGGVVSAVVTNDEGEQPIPRLWSGYFYAIPDLEGTIEIRCRNGVQKRSGYVTRHWHTTVKVVGETPCAKVVEVI